MSDNASAFDFDLIDRVRRTGDPKSKERLAEHIRALLRCQVRHLQLDPALRPRLSASDLTQDAFFEVWNALGDFRGNTAAEFSGFLRAVLFHTFADACDFQRRQTRNPSREQPIEGDTLGLQIGTPSAIVSRDEQTQIANSFIDGLPEITRTIISMRVREALGWPQISEAVGKPLGQVKMRYCRAMQELRTLMNEQERS